MNRSISARGTWPGRITLRSGWAQSRARPFNDDLQDAALRLDRGSSGFLERSARWLFEAGAPAVISSPLHPGMQRPWIDAGFDPFRELVLMERDLSRSVAEPSHHIEAGTDEDWASALRIDQRAFSPEWRVGRHGLDDARDATSTTGFLVVRGGDDVAGFAIVGVASSTGYLQRIAVEPDAQGSGFGRSLLRASLAWARGRAARTLLLNTQLDNHGAARLYRSEHFETLPQPLVLLRSTPS